MRSLAPVLVAVMATAALAGPTSKGKNDAAEQAAARMSGALSNPDPDIVEACTCDAPADIDEQIRDANTFTATSFQAALDKRKLVLDPGEVIELVPADHVKAVDNGAFATIRRGARKLRVRVYDEWRKRPELVRDKHRELHDLVREEIDTRRDYWRCDLPKNDAGAGSLGEPLQRVGQVVDGLGNPITLRYPARHVTASYCAKPR